jgi:hypothetical protein
MASLRGDIRLLRGSIESAGCEETPISKGRWLMFHNRRVWCVSSVANAEELARKLTETTWCCCAAFVLGEYLWLNDSTSPDGAQEYAVLKRNGRHGTPIQIESITFGWCGETQALEYILETLDGKDDQSLFRRDVVPLLEAPKQHGRCTHCQ